MPRGARRTMEVQIAAIDAKIEKKERELKELKGQRAELEASRQTELAAKIVQIAAERGVTVEELIKQLV